jgi:hypothetical protein
LGLAFGFAAFERGFLRDAAGDRVPSDRRV